MRQMKPEQYFLKYSFPCAHTLLEMGSITEEEFNKLQEYAVSDKVMERGELIRLFPAAFRRMITVADNMKKDVWSLDVIKKYFMEAHNMYIDAKEGNYKFFGNQLRDFCKVYKGKVVNKEDNMLSVLYDGGQRNVLSDILPEAEIGDTVTIHQGFAVEKLE